MINTAGYIKNKSNLLGKIAYSVLVGVFGTVLLVLFLTVLIHIYQVIKFIPWIIAFNTALTGYALQDQAGDRIRHKHISSIAAGILNVLVTYMILSMIFLHMAGVLQFGVRDLLVYLTIGVVCSELGALLGIKYFRLK